MAISVILSNDYFGSSSLPIQSTTTYRWIMKFLLIISFFFVILSAFVAKASVGLFPNSPDYVCTPGEKWMHDCNTCFCDEDQNALCTEMVCPKIH